LAGQGYRCPAARRAPSIRKQETVMTADQPRTSRYRHPINQLMVEQAPLGARIADRVTRILGSWKFIVFQTIVVIIWIAINVGFITGLIPFDPYPFILLNLAFSTQAAYAAPLILLAGNRASEQDRLILEHAATEGDLEEKQNTEILKQIKALEEHILSLEQTILARMGTDPAMDPPS
jgi:uncharacterized membrane protein